MADIQLSDAEVRTIISGVEVNVRADGRSRVQHRPLHLDLNPIPHACGSSQVAFAAGGDGEETKVLVSIMADVVEIEGDYEANPALQRGSLEIHLDCVPTVQMLYGKLYSGGVSMRNSAAATNKGRLTFLTHATISLSKAFGAKVSLSGAASSAVDVDFSSEGLEGGEEGKEEDGQEGAVGGAATSSSNNDDDDANNNGNGFNAASASASSSPNVSADRICGSFYRDLYLGHGFAYELHADVNVLQGGGGNVLTAASAGIIAALKVMQLPRAEITAHGDGSASVEVNTRQARVGAPIRLHEVPLLFTCCLHKGFYVVDPTLAEEVALPSVVTVGITDQKVVTSVNQTAHTGRRAFPEGSTLSTADDMLSFLNDAVEIGVDVLDSIDRTVAEAREMAETRGGAAAKGATNVASLGK